MNKILAAYFFVLLASAAFQALGQSPDLVLSKADGYRGVWYQRQKLDSEFRYKYSGGLGTYCAKHQPFAVYCPEVNKTFFCYGGVNAGYHKQFNLDLDNLDPVKTEGALLHLVSYFDHKTGMVPKPTVLLDKRTHDAHDNPVLSVDKHGFIWILSTAHGSLRPAYVHRSKQPYNIDEFERVEPFRIVDGKRVPINNFSYMQAWNDSDSGFSFFFTKYENGRRETRFATSVDGIEWDNWTQIANIEQGHYQISAANAEKAACAFNYHPTAFAGDAKRRGLNWRTNLYYIETTDSGKTWNSANGTLVSPPISKPDNAALVHDFESEELLVYLKDIVFDEQNFPVILFLTSRGFESGPVSGPRTWRVARWTGAHWNMSVVTKSDSNYDMGSLYVEPNNTLRIIAPTEIGPQPGNPGGEVAMWLSEDGGTSWELQRSLTKDSPYNHTYVRRPVKSHPGFYGFWADGHGREPSPSNLYFCNREGDVFGLPSQFAGRQVTPNQLLPE